VIKMRQLTKIRKFHVLDNENCIFEFFKYFFRAAAIMAVLETTPMLLIVSWCQCY
jgi:hypothetical protein